MKVHRGGAAGQLAYENWAALRNGHLHIFVRPNSLYFALQKAPFREQVLALNPTAFLLSQRQIHPNSAAAGPGSEQPTSIAAAAARHDGDN